ncbi:geraniol 8-hydroxylase, partial [Phtheirospermum japonicum]
RTTPDAVTAENGYELALPWLPACLQWKKLKKICNTHIFSPQKLDSLRDLRHQAMKNMVQRVIAAQEVGEVIPIGGLVFATVVQLLSNSLFSSDMLNPASDAMKELQVLHTCSCSTQSCNTFKHYFPFLRPFDLQGIKRTIKLSYDRLHELIDDMMDRRMKQRSSGSERYGDILDVLLDYTEDDGPQGLTHLDVKLLITEVFIGGMDTSIVIVEWVMTELLHYPTILSKLKQELSDKIIPGETVQEQDIPRLTYLTAVIKETMRLHPATPLLLPRRAEQEVENSGIHHSKTHSDLGEFLVGFKGRCILGSTHMFRPRAVPKLRYCFQGQ